VSLLPWLLDWPPSRRSVAVFVVVTAVSVGTVVGFGGVVDRPDEGNVTVEAVDVTVALNDEVSYPEGGDGSVQTCLASGTPGDSVSVTGDVIVDVPEPDGLRPAGERRLNVTVSLAHTDETTAGTVEGPGTETHDVFWILEDDESLTAGDNETIQVWVSEDGTPVANATRTVPVEEGSRTYDCD
jgi:hypothetical protein